MHAHLEAKKSNQTPKKPKTNKQKKPNPQPKNNHQSTAPRGKE